MCTPPLFAPPQRMAEPIPSLPLFFPPPKYLHPGGLQLISPLWDSSVTSDPHEKEVLDRIISSDLLPLSDPDTPTLLHRFSPEISFGPSTLAFSCSWEVLQNLGSDHLPILLSDPLSPVYHHNERPPSFNFQKARWNDFTFYFNSHCPSAEEYSSLSLSSAAALFSSLALNAAKSSIPFGRIKRPPKAWWSAELDPHQANLQPNLLLLGSRLRFNPLPTFLGVTFDRTLSFSKHVSSLKAKFFPRLKALRCISASSWGPCKKSLSLLYKSFLWPLFTYASPGWFPFLRATNLTKLKRLHRAASHAITGCLSSSPIPLLLTEAVLPLLRVTLTHFTLFSYERALCLPISFPISGLARLGVKPRLCRSS